MRRNDISFKEEGAFNFSIHMFLKKLYKYFKLIKFNQKLVNQYYLEATKIFHFYFDIVYYFYDIYPTKINILAISTDF